MNRKIILATVTLLLATGFSALKAQNGFQQPSDERSAFEERRKSILDANQLRATYHNYGFAGRASAQDELVFEFPKNTNRWYIYFVSIFTGAEVANQGGSGNARFPVVVAPNYRTNPQTGESWAQNPIVGYYNDESEEIARSDRGPNSPLGNTWPSFWPDKMEDETDPGWSNQWNGFFGKGIFNADQEFYYRSGDDMYTRYINNNTNRFRPDNTDSERGGLGLVMDSRILAWTQNLIAAVHFNIFEIRNDASFDYDKVSFMLWTADWVGTPSDDEPFFDQQRSTAYFTDSRRTVSPPEFDGTAIGAAGIRFLETPGNAVDGIDNDGDADEFIRGSIVYDDRNPDLIDPLLTSNGGFFASRSVVLEQVVPLFTASSFNERTILPNQPIVLIDDDGNRILTRYPVSTEPVTVISQGREIILPPGGLTVREDTLLGRHLNLFDDDLDGLIDENQPNHLTLTRVLPNGNTLTRPVRHINYLYSGFYENIGPFPARDTIQRGLVVPNSWIRERMSNDPGFSSLVTDYQNMLKELYRDRLDTSQFSNYFQNIHTSAPMIDESREDFFDNNQNWRSASDDVGIDGVEGTGSRGEGDGFPSSGAFTPFPGESNIDKTDVKETDAIGITSATFRPAGGLNLAGADTDVWQTHMLPGRFMADPDPQQDSDQFITSSFFPLRRGSIERFAVAITVAQTNAPTRAADIEQVSNQLDQAFNAYNANYQFATAPPPPIVKAVSGNGRVTLYWDDLAEFVFDRYLDRLGVNPNNFEGYKVYRATDPALLDARKITDGRGNLAFLKPVAQFDAVNGIRGNHPVDINGLDFYLGDDTGLQRYYVDTEVINGRIYYYAIVAYNSGAPTAGIAPSESPINLSINPDGSLSAGVNVVRVIPSGQSAGYVGPQNPTVNKVSGTATGEVLVDVVDPRALKVNNSYRITFRDTTLSGETYAYAYSLTNTTTGNVLLENRQSLSGQDSPVIDGLRLILRNPTAGKLNLVASEWQTVSGLPVDVTVVSVPHNPTEEDYKIVFDARLNFGTSEEISFTSSRGSVRLPSQQTNFKVINTRTGEEVPFAFERNTAAPAFTNRSTALLAYFDSENQANYSDVIYILNDDRKVAFELTFHPHQGEQIFRAMAGDKVGLIQSGRFTSADVYEFSITDQNLAREDLEVAKSRLDDIRVVPNPYIVTNIAEQRPTPVRPQQERQLHFINLPAQCTIRIFNVAGHLVQTLNVNNSIDNDRYVWNMLTKDNLDLSYGVYIYHVEAPGIGEKTGKFAVIK